MKKNEHLNNLSKSSKDTSLKIDTTIMKSGKAQKLLFVKTDNNLSFRGHAQSMCKQARPRLHAVSRISKYMDDKQVKQTIRVFLLITIQLLSFDLDFSDR